MSNAHQSALKKKKSGAAHVSQAPPTIQFQPPPTQHDPAPLPRSPVGVVRHNSMSNISISSAGDPSEGSADDEEHVEGDDSLGDGETGGGTVSSGTSDDTSALNRRVNAAVCCGVSTTVALICSTLMLVSLIFIYQAIPLAEQMAAADLLHHQELTIVPLFHVTALFEEEIDLSLRFLQSTPGSAIAANLTTELTALRTKWHNTADNILAHELGDWESSEIFKEGLLNVITKLNIRTEVDNRLITGPQFSNRAVDITNELIALVLLVARDSRAGHFVNFISQLHRVRHLVTLIDHAGLMARAIMLNADGLRDEYYLRLLPIKKSIDDELIGLRRGGDENTRANLDELEEHGMTKFLSWMDLLLTRNQTLWAATLTDTEMITALGHDLGKRQDAHVEEEIEAEQDRLLHLALVEGMKMMTAGIVATATLAFVIYINNHEQTRLKKALEGAQKLKKAVQRFVPKNHLKSMGVRSILQVNRGMSTELNQALLFSHIGNFTLLSSSMTNAELFDWLQNYIERTGNVISKNKGYISNLIGDAIFGVFSQATNSVNAAVEMHVSVDTLNLEMVSGDGENLVSIGVGLHMGVVVAGVFGNDDRLSCVHIATHVNQVAQIEGLTKTFGSRIIASDVIVDNINPELFPSVRRLGEMEAVGAIKPIKIYDIYEADALALKNHKRDTKEEFERGVAKAVNNENPVGTAAIFARIADAAREQMIHDRAAEHRVESLRAAAASGEAGGGAMSFDKEGGISPRAQSLSPRTQNLSPRKTGGGGGSPRAASLPPRSSPAARNTALSSSGGALSHRPNGDKQQHSSSSAATSYPAQTNSLSNSAESIPLAGMGTRHFGYGSPHTMMDQDDDYESRT